MSLNFIGISVGNTRTRIGIYEDGKLTSSQTHSNKLIDQLDVQVQISFEAIRAKEGSCVVLSSVNPAITERVKSEVIDRLETRVYRVEEDLNVPIGRQLDPETIVGEDRLLNAAAAYDVLKQACVVVDAGTALTIDFVDGAGTFHGGAIVPGAGLMLAALHEHTAALPEISFAVSDEPIGHSTAQAMRVGVYHGVRGVVRELVEQYAQVAGSFPIVVATGGDAQTLFEGFDLIDRIVPDLTLQGMALALRTAVSAGS